MEAFRIVDLIIILILIYLLYKGKTKTPSKTNVRFFNNLVDEEVIGETLSNPYNPNDKQSVLSKIDRSIDFFRENDLPKHLIEHDIKRKELVSRVFDNPESKEEIIFHGGCLSCTSQEKHGIGRCIGCQYFTADWSLPDLSIKIK